MKFDKVKIEHVNLAIKDFKEKGFSSGFKASAYFDVELEGTLYPPKPVMAYANYHATGEVPINNFSGGVDTPCFKAYERLGIHIIKKTKNMSLNTELYKLKEDFLKEWPIERLITMPIEVYTNLDKTSFCYSLEAITTDIGSIWGGSAYKFGIFKRKHLKKQIYDDYRKSDGVYSWHEKYGGDNAEAFESIRKIIINIATSSKNNKLEEIEGFDLGDAVKWKIAFLYGDYNIINIFKHNALKTTAEYLGYPDIDLSYPALNKYILSQKGEKDYFDFAKELWAAFNSLNLIKAEFEKWLKSKHDDDNAKVSLFIKAIDILIYNFKLDIYSEDEVEGLDELYEDLKLNQKDKNGIYYYSKAKYYGNNGVYSESVGAYI
ncbi:MAG: 5-methylcytosine-specific restriction protein B, partial [Flavobacteriaceae bacterium]